MVQSIKALVYTLTGTVSCFSLLDGTSLVRNTTLRVLAREREQTQRLLY